MHGYDHACNVYANNTADSQKYGNFEDGGNNKLKYVRTFLDFIKYDDLARVFEELMF